MTLLEKTVVAIPALDETARENARKRLSSLTMPHWALGRVMDLAENLAAMAGTTDIPIGKKTVVVMAGDHGVTEEGVSKYPKEVTAQMIYNFLRGGAGVNAMARVSGAKVVVADMGVAADLEGTGYIAKKVRKGTSNMAIGPAMSVDEARRSVENGIEIALELADDTDIFGTGEMGIGNTTPSSAIISALAGVSPREVTGKGTGIDEAQWERKVKVVEKALEVNRPNPRDGLDVLSKVGGFEIGGIAGMIIGAASKRKPVVIDGFISTAGALIASVIEPKTKNYLIASHLSVEPGHRIMLNLLGLEPYLDLDLRLGEGSGAALAMCVVEAAVRVLKEVATFEDAHVSRSE